MEKRNYPPLKESAYWEKLSNGLTVVIVPRPGFTKKLAYFVTDFGSVHTEFTLDGTAISAPAGIAHYLEHKLFDMPGRDISEEFAALGAIPNAFTSFDMTAYHFSCTQNFYESLALLLEFVSTPYFTEESVAKEQGIIGQEIDMNEDSPETKIFENLTEAMYRNHPIRVPILGTRDTIARITPQLLEQCHRAFYRPDNMLLCVVGDVEPERVCQIAAQLPAASGTVTVSRTWKEKMTCPEGFREKAMEVAMPMFQLGFKCEPPGRGERSVLQEMVGDLAAEALFGESSRLYLQLYEQGVIDGAFGGGFETVEGMAMLTASGDSWEPKTVRDAILQEAERLIREGIPETDFLRMKRSALGRRIRGLDSFDSVCFRICAYYFCDFDYFCFPEVYREITVEHIQNFLKQVVTPETMSLSVIQPIEEVTQ